jgi:hypothetical protein
MMDEERAWRLTKLVFWAILIFVVVKLGAGVTPYGIRTAASASQPRVYKSPYLFNGYRRCFDSTRLILRWSIFSLA